MLQPDKWKLHLENESTSWLISQKNESKKSRSTARWLLHGAAAGGGTRYGKLALDTRYPVNLPSEKKAKHGFLSRFSLYKKYTQLRTKYETLASSQMACLLLCVWPCSSTEMKNFLQEPKDPFKSWPKIHSHPMTIQAGNRTGNEWLVTEDSPPGKTKKDDDGRVCYAQ